MAILDALVAGFQKYDINEDLRRYLRDVTDRATTVVERVDSFRGMLQDILAVNATLVTQAQNEEMKAQNEEVKKISAWAAILFAPTLIGTVYGMNFQHMPELQWYFGYPFALALMVGVCVTLYLVFKRRQWL
jgi:magnesium transporter